MDYSRVPDRSAPGIPGLSEGMGLLGRSGAHPGRYIHGFLSDELERLGVRTFGDLRRRDARADANLTPDQSYKLVVMATDITGGRLLRLPWDYARLNLDPDEQLVADAVRASISIPLFFEPVKVGDGQTGETHTLVDGAGPTDANRGGRVCPSSNCRPSTGGRGEMWRSTSTRAAVCATLCLVSLAGAAPGVAAPPENLSDDGNGKRWRQLTQTTGLAPDQVAQVCPRDGETRCVGSVGSRDLTGWVWATGAQVHALMGLYEPAIVTADPPVVGGPEYLGSAMEFLDDMAPTLSVTGYNFHHSFTGGWTSSTEADGRPTFASAGFGWYPIAGSFGVGPATNPDPIYYYGVWMWRPASDDITPPAITPTVSGTAGNNGWYISDVTVTWDVRDAESEVSAVGCDVTTVTSDTAGTTFTCEATSAGGTAARSVVVKRDTTAPTVTCMTPPQVFEIYQLGAWVRATVTDATSGPGTPFPQGATNTNTPGTFTSTVTGADQAGNRTTTTCAYQVVVPACNGLTPTTVGTAQNNVINGTGSRDVIQALGGADTIYGLGGDDVICGHDGPDTIYAGDGNDWIDGGASPDDLNGGSGDDFLDGGLHNDSLRGDNGRDTCRSGEVRMSSCES